MMKILKYMMSWIPNEVEKIRAWTNTLKKVILAKSAMSGMFVQLFSKSKKQEEV